MENNHKKSGSRFWINDMEHYLSGYIFRNGVVVLKNTDPDDIEKTMRNGFINFLLTEVITYKNIAFFNTMLECIQIDDSSLKKTIEDTPAATGLTREQLYYSDIIGYAAEYLCANELLQQLFVDEFSDRYSDLITIADDLRRFAEEHRGSDEYLSKKLSNKMVDSVKKSIKGTDDRAVWFMEYYMASTAEDKYGYFPYQVLYGLVGIELHRKDISEDSALLSKVYDYLRNNGSKDNTDIQIRRPYEDPDLDDSVFARSTLAQKCLEYRIRLLSKKCGVESGNFFKYIFDEMLNNGMANTLFDSIAIQYGIPFQQSMVNYAQKDEEKYILLLKDAYKMYFFAILRSYLEERFPNGEVSNITKIDLIKDTIPKDDETLQKELLILKSAEMIISLSRQIYDWRFLFDKHRISSPEYGVRTNNNLESFEGIVLQKNSRIQELEKALSEAETKLLDRDRQIRKLQKNFEHTELLEELRKQNKELEKAVKERGIELSEKDDYIEKLEATLTAEDESQDNIEPVSEDDIKKLSGIRVIFACRDIDSIYPEIRKVFPKAIFMERETDPISEAVVDGIIVITSRISHAMFYKIRSFMKNKDDLRILYYNHKNIDFLYREVLDKFFV